MKFRQLGHAGNSKRYVKCDDGEVDLCLQCSDTFYNNFKDNLYLYSSNYDYPHYYKSFTLNNSEFREFLDMMSDRLADLVYDSFKEGNAYRDKFEYFVAVYPSMTEKELEVGRYNKMREQVFAISRSIMVSKLENILEIV